METVLLIEVEISSLRVLMEAKLEEVKWIQSRYDQLNLIEEKKTQSSMSRPFIQEVDDMSS